MNPEQLISKVIEVDGEQRLLPPFCTLQGFGETAARDLIRAREEVAKTNENWKNLKL